MRYDVSDNKTVASWAESLKKLMEFHSIQHFWGMINNIAKLSQLPFKSDYHVFVYGIKPAWEDPQNAKGGKWVWEIKRAGDELDMDKAWLHTVSGWERTQEREQGGGRGGVGGANTHLLYSCVSFFFSS